MSPDRVSVYLAMVVMLLAGLLSLAYAVTNQTRRAKRPFRFFASLVFGWMFVVYQGAAFTSDDPQRMAARAGFILLAMLYIGEMLIDWRRR